MPLQYWLTDGVEWPNLQPVAVKLFSTATSSDASERNFSTMAFIYSRLRNSLSVASVEKLVFIKSNMSAFHDMQTAEYYPSDEEGDPSEGD